MIETSHVGIFDGVLRNALFGSGPGQPGGQLPGTDGLLSILLPDGVFPDDLLLNFAPQPGLALTFAKRLTVADDIPVTVEATLLADRNHFTISAPTGIGILTDPTDLHVTADLLALGLTAEAPVWRGALGGADISLLIGGGVIAYQSTTYYEAVSDFLALDDTETVQRIMPVLTSGLEVTSASNAPGIALDLGIRTFPSDNFWIAVADVGLKLRF